MNLPYVYRNIPWKESVFKQSGRVLVSMEGMIKESRLDLLNYEGSKLSAYHIYPVLKVALTEKWVETLEKLHRNRKNQWKAEKFVSPEGEKEYRLYTISQKEPVCSSVITIFNNQIHDFSIMLEDAAPLLKKIIEDYPPVFLQRYRNHPLNHHFPSLYYLDAKNLKFLKLPAPIKEQRERTQRISVYEDVLSSGIFQAGETSGILETIEAIKCLEVLQA